MRGNFKVGKLYLVEFWDHCMGGRRDPAKFQIVGWAVKVDPEYIVLTNWNLLNPTDKEDYDKNTEDNVILRKVMIKSKLLS